MAAENIGSVYPTKIPGLDDPADIQAALKLYHYGTSNTVATTGDIVANSLVGHLHSIETDIQTIKDKALGSSVASTQPTGIDNGYIWVDSTTSATSNVQYAVSSYQTSAPSNPSTGALWVDSDTSPLTLYVWSGTQWRAIGA
jgi:hypothetical protein